MRSQLRDTGLSSNWSRGHIILLLLLPLLSACAGVDSTADGEGYASSPEAIVSATAQVSTEIPAIDRQAVVVLEWRHQTPEDRCLLSAISANAISAGECDEESRFAPLNDRRKAELMLFLETYWSFEADTKAGMVRFDSAEFAGNTVPPPAVERMLAAWAWVVTIEALTGSEPEWNLVLAWREENGSECRALKVMLTGTANAFDCTSDPWHAIGELRLQPPDLEELYDWYDRYGRVDSEVILFHGRGPGTSPETDQRAMRRFAEGTFAVAALPSMHRHAVTISPFIRAPYVRFDSWSANSEWIAYWLSSAEDLAEQGGYPPGVTLHFTHVPTGESCVQVQFHEPTDSSSRVRWAEDGTAKVTAEGTVYTGRPCQKAPFELAEGPPDNLLGDEDASLSPDGRFRAETLIRAYGARGQDLETRITDRTSGEVLLGVDWSFRGAKGDLGLGGEWVAADKFLIYETLDQGPLLLDASDGVRDVLRELFEISYVPQLESDGFAFRAQAIDHDGLEGVHILLLAGGEEGKLPLVRLYHGESGEVETLPFHHAWWQQPGVGWLVLFKEVVTQQSQEGDVTIGYQLWGRQVEAVDANWELIAPAVDSLLWADDYTEMAYSAMGSRVIRKAFPRGTIQGRWDAQPFRVNPVSFSPDGRHLVAVGYVDGEWDYGLFLLSE